MIIFNPSRAAARDVQIKNFLTGVLLAFVLLGCATSGPDAYVPLASSLNGVENHDLLVLLDSRIQYSVACPDVRQRPTPDGRLEVTAQLRNRENHALSLRLDCDFKDLRGRLLQPAAPAQTVTLNAYSTQPVQFVSTVSGAAHFTLRIQESLP